VCTSVYVSVLVVRFFLSQTSILVVFKFSFAYTCIFPPMVPIIVYALIHCNALVNYFFFMNLGTFFVTLPCPGSSRIFLVSCAFFPKN